MTELKEWLNSINTGKNNLIDEDSDLEKKYPSYIVNRCLSGHIDAVMFANEMNKHPNLTSSPPSSSLPARDFALGGKGDVRVVGKLAPV